jgi:hypothetical protein
VDGCQNRDELFLSVCAAAVIGFFACFKLKRHLSTLIFKTLTSGTSVELTLITSRTSPALTLANADSDPKPETRKKPNLTYFGEKKHVKGTLSKCALISMPFQSHGVW